MSRRVVGFGLADLKLSRGPMVTSGVAFYF